jgi:hypothetical protein
MTFSMIFGRSTTFSTMRSTDFSMTFSMMFGRSMTFSTMRSTGF